MFERSSYTMSPREPPVSSHKWMPSYQPTVPSTSAARFDPQMYKSSSSAQYLPSEQSVQSPTVIIEARGNSNPGPSFSETPKILKEYSLSTQSLQVSKEGKPFGTLRENYSSSQSTPTQSRQRDRRNRIAARFDKPLD